MTRVVSIPDAFPPCTGAKEFQARVFKQEADILLRTDRLDVRGRVTFDWQSNGRTPAGAKHASDFPDGPLERRHTDLETSQSLSYDAVQGRSAEGAIREPYACGLRKFHGHTLQRWLASALPTGTSLSRK